MEREIGVNRMHLQSCKGRFVFTVFHPTGGVSTQLCVDGADVLCKMYEALCVADGGTKIEIEKLRQPIKFSRGVLPPDPIKPKPHRRLIVWDVDIDGGRSIRHIYEGRADALLRRRAKNAGDNEDRADTAFTFEDVRGED